LASLDAVLEPLEAEDDPADARAVAHFWRGKFLVELGEIEAAREAYTQALALRPRYTPARDSLERLRTMPAGPSGGR
jgi:lipoprotein NlpI